MKCEGGGSAEGGEGYAHVHAYAGVGLEVRRGGVYVYQGSRWRGIAHVHAYVHTKAQLERGCGDGTTPEGDCQNGAGSRHPPAAGTTMHASMSEYN